MSLTEKAAMHGLCGILHGWSSFECIFSIYRGKMDAFCSWCALMWEGVDKEMMNVDMFYMSFNVCCASCRCVVTFLAEILGEMR